MVILLSFSTPVWIPRSRLYLHLHPHLGEDGGGRRVEKWAEARGHSPTLLHPIYISSFNLN